MRFWNKKTKPHPPEEPKKNEETIYVPENPFISFELVDGVHLEINMAWPLDGDIKPFARFLALLNSGTIIGPQLAEAALFGNRVNQPEKVVAIHAALDPIMPGRKKEKDKIPADKPLVPPSRVVYNQMKIHSH